MKTRTTHTRRTKAAIGVAAAAVAVLGLSGCTNSDSGDGGDVTVVGNGEVRGTPDILNATVGIEVSAPDVAGAVSTANERANAMIDALSGSGVAKEDIQTNQLSVSPEYNNLPTGGTNTITGYRVTNSVRIVVRDLSKASEVLDKAVKAGGDNARLDGVSFDIDDNTQLLADARERAFNDAKARAEQYAELSGESLGDVITITEVRGDTAIPQPQVQRDTLEGSASFALEPGQQTVSFQVTVKWSLD
ncbi:SIMPL domain-containing protein [Antrihabitans sp. YC3-6]|uniref:SIMPL domain-containing protein n=1 Tax=Antrihabitans stalagmiti TaxID=2799499 RepID=A0A934NQW9_9NOCA|nr:SIMPL domain-containing protein [Antrihabitans stalagmiti]MBJ8339655.1 SIMPL domain-containing protein [Antrihabitans stalagmiti]